MQWDDMKNIFQLANDRPQLSARDLILIDHNGKILKRDRMILRRDGLQGMEKMEDWGIP